MELDPGHADAWTALAELRHSQLYPPMGDHEELLGQMEGYLERALSQDPSHPRAISLLGLAAAERGDRDEALRLSRRAIELAPNDARAQLQMGSRLAERGLYEASLPYYEDAVRLDPFYPTAQGAKLWILGKLGRFDEALDAHEALRRIEPAGPTIDTVLGDIYFMAGDLDFARRTWSRALESALPVEDTSYIEIALGVVDALDGNVEEARRVAEQQRESPPRTLDHLIQLFALVGEHELALRHIRESSFYANYRWVATTPALQNLFRDPEFSGFLDELYLKWERDVAEIGAVSMASALPTPAVLRQVSIENGRSTEP